MVGEGWAMPSPEEGLDKGRTHVFFILSRARTHSITTTFPEACPIREAPML